MENHLIYFPGTPPTDQIINLTTSTPEDGQLSKKGISSLQIWTVKQERAAEALTEPLELHQLIEEEYEQTASLIEDNVIGVPSESSAICTAKEESENVPPTIYSAKEDLNDSLTGSLKIKEEELDDKDDDVPLSSLFATEFNCERCPASYQDRQTFLEHARSHSHSYVCELCCMQFRKLTLLDAHLLSAHKLDYASRKKHKSKPGEKEFSCTTCERAYSSYSSLVSHERTHTSEAFTCHICKKLFMAKYALSEHIIRLHLRLRQHKCKFCKKRFGQKTALTLHLRKHTGKNLFYCPEGGCDKHFTFKARLTRHLLTHTDIKPFLCPHCPSSSRDKAALEKHIVRLHTDVPNYICDICGEGFVLKTKLELHIASHTGEHPNQCTICSKTFASKTALKHHIMGHSGINPYLCTICGKGCRDKTYHMRIHSNERPFKCVHCEKAFRCKNHLELHSRVHSGIRPYTCDVCFKSFSFKSNLNAHVRLHSGEKLYICPKCNKAFPYQSGLRRHIVAKVCEDKFDKNIDLPTLLRPKVLSTNNQADPARVIYECERCQKEFYHKSSFNRHNKLCPLRYDINAVQDGVSINKFRCETCGRCYKNRSSLSMHKRMHLSKFISCGICSKPFIRKSHYKEHMLSKHSMVKPFRCRYCGKTFHLKHILQRHIRKAHNTVADETNYETVTNNGSNVAYDLTTEIISNYLDSESSKPFKCKECGRCYKTAESLEKHALVHVSKQFCCTECTKVFSKKVHLDEHVLEKHSAPKIPKELRVVMKCMYCDEMYEDKQLLDQHVETHTHWSISADGVGGAVYATNTTMQQPIVQTAYTFHPTFHKAQIPTYTIQRAYWDNDQLNANSINVTYETIAMETADDNLSIGHGAGTDVIYVIDAQSVSQEEAEPEPEHDNEPDAEPEPEPEPDLLHSPSPPPPLPPLLPPTENKQDKLHKCDVCHKLYSSIKSLKTHKLAHDGKSVDCVFCGKAFAPKLLRSHVKNVHMTVKMLKCPICMEFYTKKKLLDEHLKIHMEQENQEVCVVQTEAIDPEQTDAGIDAQHVETIGAAEPTIIKLSKKMKKPVVDKPYKCNDCGKSYYTRTSLSTHRRIHTGKALICVFCQKQFIKRHQLKDHVTAVHMKVKNYPCEHCTEVFARKISLEKHIKSHFKPLEPEVPPGENPAKPYRCTVCDKCFGSKNYLNEHSKLHTGKGIPCHICGKMFTKEKAVREHVMAMHTHVKPFVCEFCNRAFTQKSNYNLHRRKHTGEKLRECNYCNKKFTSQAPLRRHLRSHTGQKPFSCTFCDKTFADQSNLKKHVGVHTGDKRYTCDLCNAGFNAKNAYLTHMANHDPNTRQCPKPEDAIYECEQCNLKFHYKSHLTMHKRAHKNNSKPFICEACGKGFCDKYYLMNHLKTHSGSQDFTCAICLKTFATKAQVRSHMGGHTRKMAKLAGEIENKNPGYYVELSLG